MNRRNVLLGLGTAAAGSGIVFGSGAFTQVQASRDITIGVSNDGNALVGLDPNSDVAAVFQDTDTGELAIDTSKLSSGDKGYNVGSTVQIGDTADDPFGDEVDKSNPAFTITNNRDSDVTDEIDIAIDLTNIVPDEEDQINALEFIATNDSGTSKVIEAGSRKVFRNISQDDSVYVAIRVETSNTTGEFSVDDGVVIQAGSDLTDEEFPTEQPAGANTVVRDSDGTTFNSIQSAIDDSETETGATLSVGPGAFDESVTVDTEGLTLEGPNAGIAGDSDARGSEAIITGSSNDTPGLRVANDSVTVDGLQIENPGQDGVRFGPDTVPSEATIQNNVITNIAGAEFAKTQSAANGIQFQFANGAPNGETASNIRILDNEISDISAPDNSGELTATAIDVLPRGNDIDGLEIDGNTISDIEPGTGNPGEARGIIVDTQKDDPNRSSASADAAGAVSGLSINDNDFTNLAGDDVTVIALFEDYRIDPRVGPENFTITNNEISNLDGTSEAAVFIGGYETLGADHEVSQNVFRDGTVERFSGAQSGFDPNAADELNLVDNTFTSTDTEVYVTDGTTSDNLDTVLADNTFDADVEIDTVVLDSETERSEPAIVSAN